MQSCLPQDKPYRYRRSAAICRTTSARRTLTISPTHFTDVPPPIEYGPPFSLDFVAHLHGYRYPADVAPLLMRAVQRDPDGARMLDALESVRIELRVSDGCISSGAASQSPS
jgi:hypothetical protein